MIEEPTFPTPEAAALAGGTRTPAAQARVVEVRPHPDGEHVVWVVLQLGEPRGFHDQEIVTCERQDDGGWIVSSSTGSSGE